MRHLILMDPLKKLNLQLDSSLKLARAFAERGDDVRFTQSDYLFTEIGASSAKARTYSLPLNALEPESREAEVQIEDLSTFSAIHMRKEPPFNMEYISCLWQLMMIKGDKTVIYNAPKALLEINEKLSIFAFPGFADKGLVTSNVDQAIEFSTKYSDVIVKPLDLYGGRGIERVNTKKRSASELITLFEKVLSEGARIIQPFNEAIFEGEIRVFGFGEVILSTCLKKPKQGSYFANTREGATLHPIKLSKSLTEKIASMGTVLKSKGAPLWGIDVIGEHLSEINVTSPRLLLVEEDENHKYQELAELIEQDITSQMK